MRLKSTPVIKIHQEVKNTYVVGAAPTGDAPTTTEWSTISLTIKVLLILEVWRRYYPKPDGKVTWKHDDAWHETLFRKWHEYSMNWHINCLMSWIAPVKSYSYSCILSLQLFYAMPRFHGNWRSVTRLTEAYDVKIQRYRNSHAIN